MVERVEDVAVTRRCFVRGGLAAGAILLLGGCSGGEGDTRSAGPRSGGRPGLDPTPECPDDGDPTPSQSEGPFYTPNSPETATLAREGDKGTRLVLAGTVLTTACQPVSRALLDFWQADGDGTYDNAGYRFRGHQFTDAQGRYQLETVVPGLYSGRTRHLHVKVQPPAGRLLTTQLYFPGEPANERDGIFNPACVMDVRQTATGQEATFNFVVGT